MKQKNKILIYPLILLGFVLILIKSCELDELLSKKEPVITWENPADISFGTLLSSTQLNATANVPGIFVYTPELGTLLSEGSNQDLKVDFTPTDTATYHAVSKTVKINVTASAAGGISFNPNLTYGTMTDQDGNTYKTITIGTQTWMAENLRTTKYRNGDPIPNITDITEWVHLIKGAYCDYNNTPGNSIIYGKLYNWYTIADGRNIAPAGWHVPTDDEWTTLTNYLGNDYAADKLKETGITHWGSTNVMATNESGFTALPGGDRSVDGSFSSIGNMAYWWSSTEYISTSSYKRWMNSVNSYVSSNYNDNYYGFSIRCIKDK